MSFDADKSFEVNNGIILGEDGAGVFSAAWTDGGPKTSRVGASFWNLAA